LSAQAVLKKTVLPVVGIFISGLEHETLRNFAKGNFSSKDPRCNQLHRSVLIHQLGNDGLSLGPVLDVLVKLLGYNAFEIFLNDTLRPMPLVGRIVELALSPPLSSPSFISPSRFRLRFKVNEMAPVALSSLSKFRSPA
jgi:hypothetical protein